MRHAMRFVSVVILSVALSAVLGCRAETPPADEGQPAEAPAQECPGLSVARAVDREEDRQIGPQGRGLGLLLDNTGDVSLAQLSAEQS